MDKVDVLNDIMDVPHPTLFRLIINDSLKSGTQLPFIKRAVEAGYGVIVFNTNENRVQQGDSFIPVRVRP